MANPTKLAAWIYIQYVRKVRKVCPDLSKFFWQKIFEPKIIHKALFIRFRIRLLTCRNETFAGVSNSARNMTGPEI
jgi:hypothetical protein